MSTFDELIAQIGNNPPIRANGVKADYNPTTTHKDVIYFAIDTQEIYFNGKIYGRCDLTKLEQAIQKIQLDLYGSNDLGNAVLVNKSSLRKVSVPVEELDNYPPDEWEPIGVVVIPTNHNVYGTGECGVMALKMASSDSFDHESDDNSYHLMWGGKWNDSEEIKLYPKLISMGTMDGEPQSEVTGLVKEGYLPTMYSRMNPKVTCPHDPVGSYYLGSPGDTTGYLPSPYLADDSRNPNYYQRPTTPIASNALSDFDGKFNTHILCSKATSQPDWKTENIVNQVGEGYYPAACVSWKYHTLGTDPGDWYLPACGEVGYISARLDKINDTLSSLSRFYNITPDLITSPKRFWTSTLKATGYVWGMHEFKLGRIWSYSLNYKNCVLPFIRLSFPSTKFYTKEEVNVRLERLNNQILTINSILEDIYRIINL